MIAPHEESPVLIVEDDRKTASLIALYLEKEGMANAAWPAARVFGHGVDGRTDAASRTRMETATFAMG